MKYRTRALTLRTLLLLVLVAILAVFSPPSSHTLAYVQTKDTVVQQPGTPTAVSVSVIDHDSLRVSWAAAASGGTPTGYDLRYKTAGGDSWTTVSNVTSPHVLDGLTPNTVYKVKVRAKNSAGSSGWSDKSKATTQAQQPTQTPTPTSTPTPTPTPTPTATVTPTPEPETQTNVEIPGPVDGVLLSATADSVNVSWQPPVSGGAPNGYIVHLKPENSDKGKTKRPKANKTSVAFQNLESGRTYNVWVRARNEAGKGERVHGSITLPSP